MSAPTLPESLFGTWSLVRFERVIEGDDSRFPLGREPVGQLTYQPNGFMSVLLMRPDRPWPADGDFLRASDERRGVVARDFVAYAGRFNVEGDTVRHEVSMALDPERIGRTLIRTASFELDNLILTAPVMTTPTGRRTWQVLEWRRATS